MTNTSRETRENLIKKRREKKHNRDKLLEVLGGDEVIDEKIKKKTRKEIIKDFYDNFDEAKMGEEGFQSADEQYKSIKKNRYQLEKKKFETAEKKEKTKEDKKKIEDEMVEIASIAMDLENGSWWKRWSLNKNKERRDELESQRKKIDKEILELAKQRSDLERSLEKKKESYGYPEKHELEWSVTFKKDRKVDDVEEGEKDLELKYDTGEKRKVEDDTLKGYKEKYYKMIKDKQEYMEKLLSEIRDMDLGLSEDMKEKVLRQIEVDMKKDIENLELGDNFVNLADETERWLEENWKSVMEKLLDLKGKIEEKDKEIKEVESQETGASVEEIFPIRQKQFELKKELLRLKDEYESIKGEFDKKLKRFNGMEIDLSGKKEIVVETREERILRLFERYLEDKDDMLRSFFRLSKPQNESTLKGYKKAIDWKIKMVKAELEGGDLETLYDDFISKETGINEKMKEKVWENFKLKIDETMKSWEDDETLKEADETEKWLKENWKIMMEKMVDLQSKIKDTEDEKEKSDMQNEYYRLRREIDRKLIVYDDSEINWGKKLHIETWEEKNDREAEEERERIIKGDNIPESFISRKSSACNRGRLEDSKIQYGVSKKDIVGAVLVGYSYYPGGGAGMEYGVKLFVKRGDKTDMKKIVYRDSYSSSRDDWSKAFKEIVKLDAEDDKIIVTLRSDRRKEKYTFYLEKNEIEEEILSREAQIEFNKRIKEEKERLLKDRTRENGIMPSNYDLVYMQNPGEKSIHDKKYEKAEIIDQSIDLGKGECYLLIKTQIDADAADGIQYAWLKYKITPTNTELVEQENAYQLELMKGKEIKISVN